jgi:hypothetical protein
MVVTIAPRNSVKRTVVSVVFVEIATIYLPLEKFVVVKVA